VKRAGCSEGFHDSKQPYKRFKKMLSVSEFILNCEETFFNEAEQIRFKSTAHDHLAAVLCIETSTFISNIGRFVSNCKRDYMSH
jgi:hypothetical protein